MAGSIRGRINALSQVPDSGNAAYNACRMQQEVFVSIWRFLDSLSASGVATRIASNAGSVAAGNVNAPTNVRNSGADATPGFWDEAKNVNHGAFGVWRFNLAAWPWYFFLQLNTGDGAYTVGGVNVLSAGGSATTSGNLTGVVIQAAWGISGVGSVANPWLGTTNNQWADTAPNPRWGVAGGTVDVLPRTNNTGGSFAVNKSDASYITAAVTLYVGGNYRFQAFGVIADNDSIMIFSDLGPSNSWNIGGIYRVIPRSDVAASLVRPYAMITQQAPTSSGVSVIPFQQMSNAPVVYGSLAGNDARDGGILVPNTANGTNPRSLILDRMANSNVFSPFFPSNVGGPTLAGVGTYDETALMVGCYDSQPVSIAGMLGILDPTMYREIAYTGSSDAKVDLSRCFLGGSVSLGTVKVSIPWDGVTIPRRYSGNPAVSRLGVDFVTP